MEKDATQATPPLQRRLARRLLVIPEHNLVFQIVPVMVLVSPTCTAEIQQSPIPRKHVTKMNALAQLLSADMPAHKFVRPVAILMMLALRLNVAVTIKKTAMKSAIMM